MAWADNAHRTTYERKQVIPRLYLSNFTSEHTAELGLAVAVVGVMCGVGGACTAGVTCGAGAAGVGGDNIGKRVRCGAATVSRASCSRSSRAARCRSCRSSRVTDASDPPRSYALTRARVCARCVDVTSAGATPPNILAALALFKPW